MVLDIELFRTDKGGNASKVRENQAKRFKDVTLVDRVTEADTRWRKRKCGFTWVRSTTLCSLVHFASDSNPCDVSLTTS